ncbi:MAG TPA: N-acyl homoserine lactonase family protein [Solirubrobacteraceae bacterium]|nr:N-acyl homoserine lactonase family protein [Solirubrobacteraceae bacterium]
MSVTAVHPLLLGWEHGPESISLEGGSSERVLRLPITAVLVETDAGPVLLETGCDPRPYRRSPPDTSVYSMGLPEFPTDGDPLLDALAALGVAPGDLVAAAVSHLHLDHAGGLHHLAAAGVPVAIQLEELAFASARAGCEQSYLREDYALPEIRWRLLDGDAQIVPGVDALATPGHTPGHMSYLVHAPDGPWLFAVDAIDLQRGIDTDTPIGSSADPADAPLRRRSHDRVIGLAEEHGARLVPGHDPETWREFTGAS